MSRPAEDRLNISLPTRVFPNPEFAEPCRGCAVTVGYRHSAFVAWQSGNGALANVALDRALEEDPHYSVAVLLRQAIDSGAPPSLARLPMTPEDVAASYDALEAKDEAGDDRSGEPGEQPHHADEDAAVAAEE